MVCCYATQIIDCQDFCSYQTVILVLKVVIQMRRIVKGYLRFAYRFGYRQFVASGFGPVFLVIAILFGLSLGRYNIYIYRVDTKVCRAFSTNEPMFGTRFVFPALGGLLFGYDIGATSGATISVHVSPNLAVPQFPKVDACPHMVASSFFSLLSSVAPPGSTSPLCS
jgi:hypothetical protein